MTKLRWSASSSTRMTLDDAHAWCRDLREGGHDDWRLPTIQELVTLVNYAKVKPACDLADTASAGYWSASTHADSPLVAWGVYFYDGYVGAASKAGSNYVRAVWGGA